MLHAKLEPKVLDVLKEKIQMIKTDEGAIYLVGPIKLPVNLYGETVVFQWYCWLSRCQVTENYQEIIDQAVVCKFGGVPTVKRACLRRF